MLVFAALALSLPLSAANSYGAGSATFEFASARIVGDIVGGNDTSTAYVHVPTASASTTFGWSLQSPKVVANWTNLTQYEVGRPTAPEQAFYYASLNPATHIQITFHNVTAYSHTSNPGSNLLIRSTTGGPVLLSAHASIVEMGGPSQQTWFAGPESSPTLSDANSPTRIHQELPRTYLQATVGEGSLVARGNLTMYVWAAAVELRADDRETRLEPGTTDRTASSSSQSPLVREREYRLLRLDAEQAQLILQVNTRPALIAADAWSLNGNGAGAFQGARGKLTLGGQQYELHDEPLRAVGQFHLNLTKHSLADAPYKAALGMTSGAFDSRPLANAVAPSPIPSGANVRWWIWLGTIPLIAGAIVLVQRSRDVTIDDVEEALVLGRPNQSRRWAWRLLRRDPTNPDLLFLYGAASLAAGRFTDLVERLEPLAQKVPRRLRTGIAYTLAAGAQALGDDRRRTRWAQEAAHEPLLMQRMTRDGLWTPPPRLPATDQTGYS